jgi:anhydro-N-acetylmuramic acid kinase
MPASKPASPPLFIGLMSGTSLDGVDGVLAEFPADFPHRRSTVLASAYIAFDPALRADLMALQTPGDNEIHREALAANGLAQHYARCVAELLNQAGVTAAAVHAIGAHGQTVRHRPQAGYTRQSGNPALLAELTGIDVIADFRSRDVAAGGQGAPLVPAFHHALFADLEQTRVIANIGGIANISVLQKGANGAVIGFDTGPGNILMDLWIERHQGKKYDAEGAWAAGGAVIPALLEALCNEPFLALPPPKSTGRDLFDADWLATRLAAFPNARPTDVQATLAAFTASSMADAIAAYAKGAEALYVCGGGAYNTHLMHQLKGALRAHRQSVTVESTEGLGVPPNHVEALAFAWLAHRFSRRQPGNLQTVTGAKGPRILGALYPA